MYLFYLLKNYSKEFLSSCLFSFSFSFFDFVKREPSNYWKIEIEIEHNLHENENTNTKTNTNANTNAKTKKKEDWDAAWGQWVLLD